MKPFIIASAIELSHGQRINSVSPSESSVVVRTGHGRDFSERSWDVQRLALARSVALNQSAPNT